MFYKSTDFETRSACNLIKEGAYRYATDPTTQAICCSWRNQQGIILSWWPDWVAKIIDEAPEHRPDEDDDVVYTAWNSAFDRLIWQYVCESDYGFTPTEIEDWICTSALARSNGLPGKLENAAIALGIKMRKDRRGEELIKLLSIPCGGTLTEPEFNEDPKLLREMIAYCEQDVRVEYGILQQMRPFLPHELLEFHASERINDRGIGVDIEFAREAATWGDAEKLVFEKQLFEVTGGQVERPTQYKRVKDWLHADYHPVEDDDGKGPRYYPVIDPEAFPEHKPRVSREAVKQMTVYKGGIRKISLDKAVRHNILEIYNTEPDIVSPEALEVIQLTDLANKSSTAKYKKMIKRELDGRVNGAYMFAGAPSTGRYSAHGIQPHNMVRDVVEDFDAARTALREQSDTEVIHTLAKMMRPTIIASPGTKLHWSDWSNVEGRACPWLANTPSAKKKLEMFIHQDNNPDDPDVYERMAERMSLDNRQTGKVAELSMQFGGGIGAFQAMARNYQVHVSNNRAGVIQKRWREANPWAKPFWYALKDAAWTAIARPGTMNPVGRVTYFYTPDTHNGLGTLWCQLPSKRLLAYVNPKFERVSCPWNEKETMVELTAIKANFKPKAGEKEWPRYKLWYGVLCENITQAVCADLLRDVLVRFDDADLNVVVHTHDEVIVEDADDVSDLVVDIMQELPEWAEGLPLAADINRGTRYKMKEKTEVKEKPKSEEMTTQQILDLLQEVDDSKPDNQKINPRLHRNSKVTHEVYAYTAHNKTQDKVIVTEPEAVYIDGDKLYNEFDEYVADRDGKDWVIAEYATTLFLRELK